MDELIRITIDENGKQLASARELYKELDVKTRFSQWVTQNFKNFREGVDFTSVVTTTVVNNGAKRELDDYAMTVEMAKHVSMMTGTPKGFEVREYFIQIETMWNSPEMITKRALEFQQKKIESLQLENAEMKPKALFADAVEASKSSILIGELAKVLKQNGIDIGQKRLFKWLRNNGYLIKRGEEINNPTQYSLERGWFELKKRTGLNADGSTWTSSTTKVTGKGQIYFVNKFLNEADIA